MSRPPGSRADQQPSLEDPVVTALSEVVGGPVGEHARPHRWWTPVRVVLAVFTVVFAMGLLAKYPCAQTHWSSESVRYSKMCYSDVPYLYTGRGFAEHLWPYAEHAGAEGGQRYEAMEYPVGISYLAWLVSQGTRLWPDGPSATTRASVEPSALWGLPGMAGEVNFYFVLTALALLLCGLGAAYFLTGASRGRPWDAMAFAASPALLMTGLINWDLLAVLFVAGALWAWARGRVGLAGVMVGLGFATKLYPVFLLGAFLVDAVRGDMSRRERRHVTASRPGDLGERLAPFGVALCTAALTWSVVNVPAWATGLDRWLRFWSFNDHRGIDLGSPWLVAQHVGASIPTDLVNAFSLVGFAAACAGIFLLGVRAPQAPRVAQVAFLVVAAFLLVNKVYSPQYVLWLLPLAVLARPRWRDLLIWQAGEVLYVGAVWLYLGGWLAPSSGSTPVAYDAAIVLRMAAELYLVALVVRDIRRGPGSADLDAVERGRGEPHPNVHLATHRRGIDA